MVTYFSELSCQHPPLNTDILQHRVKQKLLTPTDITDIPIISAYDVWQIHQGKNTIQSCFPGDLPAKLRYKFQVELSKPAVLILNNISQTGEWCKDWLQEFGTNLKKIQWEGIQMQNQIIVLARGLVSCNFLLLL